MADALTQYKLVILYMLDKVNFPLTNTQICIFILEKEYTSYFTFQRMIHELLSSELIRKESTHNNTYYYITPAGRETLSYFPDKISNAIKKDVISYFEANGAEIKKDIHIMADYYKTTHKSYVARCQLKNMEIPMIDLKIKTNTREQAKAICQNWKKQNEEVYAYLMDLLLR